MRQRRPFNVVVAAVANKLARILWAMSAAAKPIAPPPDADAPRKASTSCEGERRGDGKIGRTERQNPRWSTSFGSFP